MEDKIMMSERERELRGVLFEFAFDRNSVRIIAGLGIFKIQKIVVFGSVSRDQFSPSSRQHNFYLNNNSKCIHYLLNLWDNH
jgi:hypothetical protein